MDSVKPSNSFLNSYNEQLHSFQLPDRLADSYQLRDCLKTSSNKEIYLLSDAKESQFILKRGTDRQIPLIKQEYQISKQLGTIQNLAVPECMDCWEEGETCYLLRDYIEGISLADYFERRLYLSDTEITGYMLEICEIIQLLHKQNPPIIHRDIKPENFIIQKGTGVLYLIDFDTARVFTPDKSRDTMLVGTPSHAAPEQFGFSQSDVRTDIYALGKTLLYLTYGSTEIKDLKSSSIAKPFQKMISRCTDFAPDKRYSDVGQLIRSLKHYQSHLNFSKSYAYQIGLGLLILALGTGLGFIGGSFYEKQDNITLSDSLNSDKESGNAAENTTSIENTTSTENDTSQMETDSTETNKAAVSSENVSLFEQSGAMECDFLEFQDLVNQIILDCYNSDSSSMAANCEKLVKALYEDEAVSQVTGTDYYGVTPSSGEDFRAPIVQIRDNLAYRDQILKQKLGSYEHYADAIYSNIYNYLTPSVINTESCLYIYATASGEKSRVEYQGALADIMNNIRMTIDWVDEQENAASSEQ
ncbi:MAG: serine/threonine protein kinase [Lachnospiraceae bacterium]